MDPDTSWRRITAKREQFLMDPEYAAALATFSAIPSEPIKESGPRPAPTIEELRENYEKYVTVPIQRYFEGRLPPPSAYTVEDRFIPGPGEDLRVRCVLPTAGSGEERTYPVVLNIHGGGKCVGTINEDDYILRCLSVELQIVTVNVEYRLAPEHPFPAGVDDCYAALKWVAENAALLRGDLSQGFIVMGHSAGAYLCAVIAHEARDDPFFDGRRLTGQLLREPGTANHPDSIPESLKTEFTSRTEYKNYPPFTEGGLERFATLYKAPPKDPRAAPILYPSHAGLPSTYIQVMDLDPLRDDGIVYERLLREAGVTTRIDRYPGVTHGFHYSFPQLKIAEKVRGDVVQGLQWLLRRA